MIFLRIFRWKKSWFELFFLFNFGMKEKRKKWFSAIDNFSKRSNNIKN
jgi:hypothetical protein